MVKKKGGKTVKAPRKSAPKKKGAAAKPPKKGAAMAVAKATASLEDLHTALWATYLSRQQGLPPHKVKLPYPLLVVSTLFDWQAPPYERLLGIAAWNAAASYATSNAKCPKELDKKLEELLKTNFAQVQRQILSPRLTVFPLHPAQAVREASWDIRDDISACTIHLNLCVDSPLGDQPGDSSAPVEVAGLRPIVNPAEWAIRCPLFWPLMSEPNKDHDSSGFLRLPGLSADKTIPVQLHSDINETPFEARIDYSIARNDQIESCEGYLLLAKEPGRPRTTRITAERTVRFTRGHLNDARSVTALYWLQAEILCLVMDDAGGAAAASVKKKK